MRRRVHIGAFFRHLFLILGGLISLFPFYWIGAVGRTGLMILAHTLMLLGMAVAMLHRRESYIIAH